MPPALPAAFSRRSESRVIYSEVVRWLAIVPLVLAGCGAPPSASDVTKEPWYNQSVQELTAITRQADDAFKAGKGDDAAALIQKGEPIKDRLLTASHPTLEAEIAASDLEDLYGRMLLSNHHYGWAQIMFQKNLSRWKHWEPQTDETRRRLKQAQDEIAETSKKMEQ
jgi:hypothetical protein